MEICCVLCLCEAPDSFFRLPKESYLNKPSTLQALKSILIPVESLQKVMQNVVKRANIRERNNDDHLRNVISDFHTISLIRKCYNIYKKVLFTLKVTSSIFHLVQLIKNQLT